MSEAGHRGMRVPATDHPGLLWIRDVEDDRSAIDPRGVGPVGSTGQDVHVVQTIAVIEPRMALQWRLARRHAWNPPAPDLPRALRVLEIDDHVDLVVPRVGGDKVGHPRRQMSVASIHEPDEVTPARGGAGGIEEGDLTETLRLGGVINGDSGRRLAELLGLTRDNEEVTAHRKGVEAYMLVFSRYLGDHADVAGIGHIYHAHADWAALVSQIGDTTPVGELLNSDALSHGPEAI